MGLAIWIVALVLLALWSAIAWAGLAALDMVQHWSPADAGRFGVPPEWVEFLSWAAGLLGATGDYVVFGVWGLGALVILAVALLLTRLAHRPRPA